MTNPWETKLPLPLLNSEGMKKKILKAAHQWSQIVAWTWSVEPLFDGKNAANEEKLKKDFIQVVQKQGINWLAYEHYGNEDTKTMAENLSNDIKSYLTGKIKVGGISLSAVLKKLTQEPLIWEEDADFAQMFIHKVVPGYTSPGIHPFEGDEYGKGKEMYVAHLGYPPRPQLSSKEETELFEWAHNSNPDELPPIWLPLLSS